MKTIVLPSPTDVSLALRRAAHDTGRERVAVATQLLRDALIAGGWLEVPLMDEETEVAGNG